jgi:hypothetical protein
MDGVEAIRGGNDGWRGGDRGPGSADKAKLVIS